MSTLELDAAALRARLREMRNRHHQLVKEYSELKERVAEYQTRRWMSQGEELEKRMLQRAKLQKKDALATLQEQLTAAEAALSTLGSSGPSR